jgi:hypothetical protein
MFGYPGHETLRQLREGKVVELDGLLFVMDEGELAPGDTYIGARNTVDVYVCRRVDTTELDCVFPEGLGYPFDTHECVKVREADPGATADYTVPTNLIAANVVKAHQ